MDIYILEKLTHVYILYIWNLKYTWDPKYIGYITVQCFTIKIVIHENFFKLKLDLYRAKDSSCTINKLIKQISITI